jgi:lysophospholipase L1-like esterase
MLAQAPIQGAPESPAPSSGIVDLASIQYPLEEANLFDPFWKSTEVYGESVCFVKESETDPADGTLLFVPNKILHVRSSDGKTEYSEGKDYTVDAAQRRLIVSPGSSIPVLNRADLYKHKGDPDSIPRKADSPEVYLLHKESGFRAWQVEVDYIRNESWSGYVPSFAGNLLPKTLAKLARGAGLTICVTGDSISTGANSSNKTPPFMPGYVPLLGLGLQKIYGGTMTILNLAVSGTRSEAGVEKLPQIIATKPDLVIIAFGMNDVGRRQPAKYAENIKTIIDGIHAVVPDTEFIVVASILANPEWSGAPADQFVPYRDALLPLGGPGVALANMTQLWSELLKNKRYLDLTGNGVNHPNDFGQRLYAKVLLGMLVDGTSSHAP